MSSTFKGTLEEQSGSFNGGYIPFGYVVDFLKFIRANSQILEVITYKDLQWQDDFNYQNNYLSEWKAWRAKVKAEREKKIFVLLQHDVDRLPERTLRMLKEEAQLNIPSNVMVFNRRIHRKHFQNTGELVYTDYPLAYDYLRQLQDEKGFIIGYHSNAYEQALFDHAKALAVFESDVAALRTHFNIDFFSPHGGPRDPQGQSNNCLPIPDSLSRSIRWVNNAQTARFDSSYSDGGINSLKRDPKKRDLRDFVKTWRPGKRYRILLHPQYYCSPCGRSPRLSEASWYEEVLECYQGTHRSSAWDDVRLQG